MEQRKKEDLMHEYKRLVREFHRLHDLWNSSKDDSLKLQSYQVMEQFCEVGRLLEDSRLTKEEIEFLFA